MHQLFLLSSLSPKGNQLSLFNVPDLIQQLRKVLRAKIGDTLFLQGERGGERYEISIISRTDKDLEGKIIHRIPLKKREENTDLTLLVALPNKREKAELIVQKLSEIGVEEILFRPAERSVIKQRNEKKAERLRKISKEAVEQSRGISLPKIGWCEQVKAYCEGKTVFVCDKGGEEVKKG
jgi:16S rRNA (uracil1498-N3)-methyltransferase